MDRETAHKLVDQIYDLENTITPDAPAEAPAETAKPKPENQRVVRTKTSGDRVYLIDEVKKTRQWLTNPDVLEKAGFTAADVVEITDEEALKYQTGPAIYRVDS